jgi:D-alanine-D-alanine ligase
LNWRIFHLQEAAHKIHPGVLEKIGYPIVIKPNEQGSTVGLTIVKEYSEIDKALEIAFKFGNIVLLEKFIPGRELTVSVLGDEALPVIEIKPKSGFYDYESKYQSGFTYYDVPAKLESTIYKNLQQAGLRAYHALGCEDYARVDFRVQDDNQSFCLEVNTLPGMTPTSLVPKAAKSVGIDFNQLIESIVKSTFHKYK